MRLFHHKYHEKNMVIELFLLREYAPPLPKFYSFFNYFIFLNKQQSSPPKYIESLLMAEEIMVTNKKDKFVQEKHLEKTRTKKKGKTKTRQSREQDQHKFNTKNSKFLGRSRNEIPIECVVS